MASSNNILPASVLRLINEFGRLPGIGSKTASRLTFYLLRAGDDGLAIDLANALVALKESTTFCNSCFNITEVSPCPVCSDLKRDPRILCVVEDPLDVVAIDRSGVYQGMYHVLHGAISPVEGVGPEDLRIAELVARVQAHSFDEIILATNATLEGDSTALYLLRRLSQFSGKITRLARGLPVGGDLEYTDEVTLGRAVEGRQSLRS